MEVGVASTVDVMQWWKGHEQELPHWASACKLIVLVQPSSAACKRIFSLACSRMLSPRNTSLLWKTIIFNS